MIETYFLLTITGLVQINIANRLCIDVYMPGSVTGTDSVHSGGLDVILSAVCKLQTQSCWWIKSKVPRARVSDV